MQAKNTTHVGEIPDIQSSLDARQIAIDKVGIKNIRYPMMVQDRQGGQQSTVASLNMYVDLPKDFKGTHMSRFVEILHRQKHAITVAAFQDMIRDMTAVLDARSGHIEMCFPYFIAKAAPVSGVSSLMDYEVCFLGQIQNGEPEVRVKVVVPVTSLCPCSKNISDYGAHNQRSHITLDIKTRGFIWIEELVEMAESVASCELYGLLKRPDEKYVTERAYDNPKFVEDLVRDVATRLNDDERVRAYIIESENFESIHNHSAYALIEHDKDSTDRHT